MRMPIVRTMRHPPDERAETHRRMAGQNDPERDCRLCPRSDLMPGGHQGSHDDAHRLLRVVTAVPQRIERRRAELKPPKGAIDAARGTVSEEHDQ